MTIMVILGQIKLIWLIKKKIFRHQDFVNYTGIIIKNRKNTGIQSIIKSYSTTFMIYNVFFSGMNIKIVSLLRLQGEVGEPLKFLLGSGIRSIF